MRSQSRNVKIFAATLLSIMIGIVILKSLGNNPPSAGAFSLSDYYSLEPVEKVVSLQQAQLPWRWSRIEVYYGDSGLPNVNQIISPLELVFPEESGSHFVVCNYFQGSDGQIRATGNWQKQLPSTTNHGYDNNSHTIRICVMGDGETTDVQVKRVELLVGSLSRKFGISHASIYYPCNWW
ncbi:N-acetylmuramoyl-L-alanine amidase [Planctomycetota bacterium]